MSIHIRSRRTAALSLAVFFAASCGAPESDAPANAAGETSSTEESASAGGFAVDSEYANPDALVDTEWVLAHLDDPSVHLIDVSRQQDIYTEGHLPGAQFVQWNTELTDPDDPVEGQILGPDALSELMSRLGVENGHTVVFYDEASSLFASRAYWVMKYYRHENVHVYNGGSRKWVADGRELTTDVAPVTPGSYVAGEPHPEIATDWEYVVNKIDDSSTLVCDVRSADEYAGEDSRAERGGHIPGAVNIEWRENVREDGTFLDAQALADLYEGHGFGPDREIITYCQVGVRAAHAWFVLRELLGSPNVRVYDGSWADYGNRADSPIQS